jgi:transaldolase
MTSSARLVQLFEQEGQSPWLDNLKRSLISSGELEKVRDSGIRGLTSNPTIFQKAIQGSADYDEQFKTLIENRNPIIDSYWAMVLQDIHGALDVFSSVYESSGGADGFVSVEVDPNLALDESGTLAAGQHLWDTVQRPNLMVKIPATQPCIPAIRAMIAAGRNVNVTLIFSLDRYQKVMDAYIDGLEDRVVAGHSIQGVASVASFFISRVDSEVDARLESLGTSEALSLRGKAAIAQAVLAYEAFQTTFSGPRWNALVKIGAKVQRPLWASTSTKNPNYPDTLYVDQLIGPDSVNTLPDTTVDAFADHGTVARTIDLYVEQAHDVWQALQMIGIDMEDVAQKLEREGVASFQKSFTELIDALTEKAQQFR